MNKLKKVIPIKFSLGESNLFKNRDNLRSELLDWFEKNGRHSIPWKLNKDGNRPKSGEYLSVLGIWIAEVMLQQTQLKVVEPYWSKWMKKIPTLEDLSGSTQQEILMLWQGLGYYSRGYNILNGSLYLVDYIGNKSSLNPNSWPKTLEEWTAIPGVGRTTAGSIISSSFDLPTSILDGNVKRILSRLIGILDPININLSYLWSLSDLLLDRDNPRNFNQALMDLGANICKPRRPICFNCPWKNRCFAYASGNPTQFPVKNAKKTIPFEVIGIGIVVNSDGMVLIDQRHDEGLLGGMWEFPGGKQEKGESIQKTIQRELQEELDIEVNVSKKLINLDHSYSHKRLNFIVYICEILSGKPKPLASQQVKWVSIDRLSEYPFPAANQKMIEALTQYFHNL